MERHPALGIGAAVLSGVLLAGAASLQVLRDRAFPLPKADQPSLYVTSGPALRRMALGYSALGADLYWIRAIQYFGDSRPTRASRCRRAPRRR